MHCLLVLVSRCSLLAARLALDTANNPWLWLCGFGLGKWFWWQLKLLCIICADIFALHASDLLLFYSVALLLLVWSTAKSDTVPDGKYIFTYGLIITTVVVI